jgi:hypothetical protein
LVVAEGELKWVPHNMILLNWVGGHGTPAGSLDEIIYGTRRDTLFLDNRRQRLLGHATGLEEGGK